MVKTMPHNRLKQKFIKTTTKEGGGTMKVFGDALNPSVPYKTFLLAVSDTAEWVVKEMLEKYGLKHEDPINYCLLQTIIPSYDQMDKKPITEVILHDKECPLNMYLNHVQRNQGSIIFQIIQCPSEYIEHRKRLHAQELALNIPQIPSLQDRTINDPLPIFIQVNPDGTDLSTPRIFKLHPDRTHVGRDAKAGVGKQYFFIDGSGIDRDHCTIENQNGIVTLIPHGDIRLNGKLITAPFVLQHGSLICFGRNSLFRYCDSKLAQKMKRIAIQNPGKSSLYSSAPVLSTKTSNFELGVLNTEQKKISPTNIIDSGIKIDVLPGLLEVPSETESQFLHAVFDNYPLNDIQFRLLPAYTLYMTIRYRLSPYGKSNGSFIQKQEDVRSLLHRIDDLTNKKIEECQEHGGYLAYWLANTSEFLYFLKQDRDLSKLSHDIQVHFASHVQRLFSHLITVLQNELDKYLIAFTNARDDHERDIDIEQSSDRRWIMSDNYLNKYHQSTLADILAILSSIMDLLRKCRVNPALTIQIFSQLFFYINAWLFNRIICYPELQLCSSVWGDKILLRLKSIRHWAQKQGLELPSECYLMKVTQLCLLLTSLKRDTYDAQQFVSDNTLKINSLQIKQILNSYILHEDEPPISNSFSQALLSIAYKYVDENLHRDGFVMQLAEEIDRNLPFLLPEDGYTVENLKGIPQQLLKSIESMSRSTLCRLFINPHSHGMWTEFIQISKIESTSNDHDRIETIVLNKKGNSLGLNIVSAKSSCQQSQGIYIKGIVPNGAADDDKRLQPGDQILRVDKTNLIDMTQEQAADVLKQSGHSVILQIFKDAANRHGLSALFMTPLELPQEPTQLPLKSNPSLISYPSTSSTRPLQSLNSHEPLSIPHQRPHFTSLPNHDHQFIPSIIHPPQQVVQKPSYSTQTSTDHISQQHHSNPNLSHSKQFNKYESNLQPRNFVRSTNRTQSFMDRTAYGIRPLVFREDIPPDRDEDYRNKSAMVSEISPKAVINTDAVLRQTDSTNAVDTSHRLSSMMRKQQEPTKLTNSYQNHINDIRSKRNSHLITKLDRIDQDGKELNSFQSEDEFDRRVDNFYHQTNAHSNREISPPLSNEMNLFDEKLKRRLRQFEQDRIYINRMLAKREAHRQEHEVQLRPIPEDDRIFTTKKEHARSSKRMVKFQ